MFLFEIPYEFKNGEELKYAVGKWCDNPEMTEADYGHIAEWNVSEVKNMAKLFEYKKGFNEDICNPH